MSVQEPLDTVEAVEETKDKVSNERLGNTGKGRTRERRKQIRDSLKEE